jgi:hypothetical protein
MKLGKIALAGLAVGVIAWVSANAAAQKTAVVSAAAPKPRAAIFVANKDSVVVYAPGQNGNVAPVASIKDRANTLQTAWGIALDSKSNIYVSNPNPKINQAARWYATRS